MAKLGTRLGKLVPHIGMGPKGHQLSVDQVLEIRNEAVVQIASAGDRTGSKSLDYHVGIGSYVVTVRRKVVYKDVQAFGAVEAYNGA